jgi:BirA family biotin operon repressor/biotin-[acetyl-CoA-carboxylase] ligase
MTPTPEHRSSAPRAASQPGLAAPRADAGPPDPAAAPAIVRLGVVDSTQAVALALAEDGAADGTAVVADSQRAGRGRRGRVWRDEPGASLLVSILTRPVSAPGCWPLLSLMTAVAVARALHRAAGVEARLKWPNDVLLDGRKVAGILLESRQRPPLVVIGIGINVGQTGFPPELADRAISLTQATGRAVDREGLLTAVLDEVERGRARLDGEGSAPLRRAWMARSATLGTWVTAGAFRGRAVDLAEDGALVLDDGRRRYRVTAGELDSEEEAASAARG